jgi:hypothetical protein
MGRPNSSRRVRNKFVVPSPAGLFQTNTALVPEVPTLPYICYSGTRCVRSGGSIIVGELTASSSAALPGDKIPKTTNHPSAFMGFIRVVICKKSACVDSAFGRTVGMVPAREDRTNCGNF